jgi:hypothetical protein
MSIFEDPSKEVPCPKKYSRRILSSEEKATSDDTTQIQERDFIFQNRERNDLNFDIISI